MSSRTLAKTWDTCSLTAREFPRDHFITVTSLSLGDLVLEEEVVGEPPKLMWVDIRDAARAFRAALGRDQSSSPRWQARWNFFHIAADLPHPKFRIDAAAGQLGYRPEHNFREHFQASAS